MAFMQLAKPDPMFSYDNRPDPFILLAARIGRGKTAGDCLALRYIDVSSMCHKTREDYS